MSQETDFRFGNALVYAGAPGNARFNMTESEIARLPEESSAEWRKLCAVVHFPNAVPDHRRFYFRRMVDRDEFARTFIAAGATVLTGEVSS